MKTKKTKVVLKMVYSAVCLALALILPFFIGQIPQIGSMLSPMHIPVFLCGFLCGPIWGLGVGFIAPLLRSAMFGMPPFPNAALPMAFELLTYGAISGLALNLLPKKKINIWISLLIAMVSGRIVWGIAKLILFMAFGVQFSWAMFLSGAVTSAIPGIILHLILVPVIIIAMQRAKLTIE